MKVGTVFASTGGNKVARCIRSFHRMEPDVLIHVVFDTSSRSWQARNPIAHQWIDSQPYVRTRYVENFAHINGVLNHGMRWMRDLGYSHVALFHDDLVFSPLEEHRYSLSIWYDYPLLGTCSGFRFSHFEAMVNETDGRRRSEAWDLEDLESAVLWRFLQGYTMRDGADTFPPYASYWLRYEGPDVIRKWNRLGPTGQIVPISTWDKLGEFDERDGIFYDGEYPSECFRRKLPPVYAVTNFPYIHLHNQSMNPWLDPAPGPFGDTMGAYVRRYGADWPGFWKDDWEQKWVD